MLALGRMYMPTGAANHFTFQSGVTQVTGGNKVGGAGLWMGMCIG